MEESGSVLEDDDSGSETSVTAMVEDSSFCPVTFSFDRTAVSELLPYLIHAPLYCPFAHCPLPLPVFLHGQILLQHLQEKHLLGIHQSEAVMPFLEDYLAYWMPKLPPLTSNDSVVRVTLGTAPFDEAEDKAVRQRLLHTAITNILRVQERERLDDSKLSRQCLFCPILCDNRPSLFQHMYSIHRFNIGLPDNLVYVNEFLNILSAKLAKLQCIFCEKCFGTNAQLRKHMRTKKHYKIHPSNHIYDKYYIVNYKEVGRSWKEIQREEEAEMEDDEEDGNRSLTRGTITSCSMSHADADADQIEREDSLWDDWNEVEDEPTMCLFDEHLSPTPEDLLSVHLPQVHSFDLKSLSATHGWKFYDLVKVVNYIRRCTSFLKCHFCEASFDVMQELSSHYETSKHETQFSDYWRNPQYLLPTYEDDPLLRALDYCLPEMEDADDENEAEDAVIERTLQCIDDLTLLPPS